VIFGFWARYPKFYISSAHPKYFAPLRISTSGTIAYGSDPCKMVWDSISNSNPNIFA
jgi:hypothetical protein